MVERNRCADPRPNTSDYHAYGVYCGEFEDEFDDVEKAGPRNLLAYFNYAPAVEVALGNTEAA